MRRHVGEIVRELRCTKNLTMADLAISCDISVPMVSLFERGKRMLPPDKIDKIIEWFEEHGIDASELRRYADETRTVIRKTHFQKYEDWMLIVKLARNLTNLSKDDRKALNEIVKRLR